MPIFKCYFCGNEVEMVPVRGGGFAEYSRCGRCHQMLEVKANPTKTVCGLQEYPAVVGESDGLLSLKGHELSNAILCVSALQWQCRGDGYCGGDRIDLNTLAAAIGLTVSEVCVFADNLGIQIHSDSGMIPLVSPHDVYRITKFAAEQTTHIRRAELAAVLEVVCLALVMCCASGSKKDDAIGLIDRICNEAKSRISYRPESVLVKSKPKPVSGKEIRRAKNTSRTVRELKQLGEQLTDLVPVDERNSQKWKAI